jgi:predicted transcriptional regulator
MTKVASVQLDDDLVARLDQLAAALNRPRAWVIQQAIARYVEQEAWQVQAIAEALAEYRGGEAIASPHDEVMARLEATIRERTADAGASWPDAPA